MGHLVASKQRTGAPCEDQSSIVQRMTYVLGQMRCRYTQPASTCASIPQVDFAAVSNACQWICKLLLTRVAY